MTERKIFTAALNKPDPNERTAYLNEICADDGGLRQRVESLLAEHEQLGSFLESPSPTSASTIDRALNGGHYERPGTRIGPYKLLQQIGEGGIGNARPDIPEPYLGFLRARRFQRSRETPGAGSTAATTDSALTLLLAEELTPLTRRK